MTTLLVLIVVVILAVDLWQLTKIFDLTQVGVTVNDSQVANDNDMAVEEDEMKTKSCGLFSDKPLRKKKVSFAQIVIRISQSNIVSRKLDGNQSIDSRSLIDSANTHIWR
jgi:hypothetical protein